MTAFVVLAAGRGSRVGRAGVSLHKALLPLDGRAVLSHIFDLAPPNSHIVLCTGYRGDQVMEYVRLAHPTLDVIECRVVGWDQPGGGPGASLLAARFLVEDEDLVYVSCDTLWEKDDSLWLGNSSWAAVAPVPAGSDPAAWCRLVVQERHVRCLVDKRYGFPSALAYVGLARIVKRDLDRFWDGITLGERWNNPSTGRPETRDVLGLVPLIGAEVLAARHVRWTDVGTEDSYRRAVATVSGYDWTKLDQATYVLPDAGGGGRVVKFTADPSVVRRRADRARAIAGGVPEQVDRTSQMLAYRYVHGVTAYDSFDAYRATFTTDVIAILKWHAKHFTAPTTVSRSTACEAALEFYGAKTQARINVLTSSHLRTMARDAVGYVNLRDLAFGCQPAHFHGDFNYGNIIVKPNGQFVGIDWREDFAGYPWGDLRYDYGKLLAGCVVHWGRARRGDFHPWDKAQFHMDIIRVQLRYHYDPEQLHDIEIIGALSLLNSAPLHAAPLDEILVSRGVAWLERLRGGIESES